MAILHLAGLLSNALTLMDAAARLWSGARKGGSRGTEAHVAEKLTSHAQGLSALEARVLALQGRTNELEREALLASQLLQSLAQQNYQVAQALEALQKRMRVLFWTSGVLAVVALGTLLSLAFH